MAGVRGRDILMEVLVTEGVRHVFGNPGTTELPFLDVLASTTELEYLVALHESVAVGMADGYAQVTRRPAFVNLHTAPGLGNAIGTLANARATGTPLVITAGQQDRRHLVAEPFLSGNLVAMASSVSKWTAEVHRVGDLGTIVRRAFHDAVSVPSGPVFVALPMDVLDDLAPHSAPAPTHIRRRTIPSDIEELAAMITGVAPGRLAIVAGDEVARSAGVDALVAVAEAAATPVFGTSMQSNLTFPTAHALWAGPLPADAVSMRQALAPFEVVLLIGSRGFMAFPYTPGPPLPDNLVLLHLSPDPADLGRTYPARLAVVGDPRATLEALLPKIAAGAGDPGPRLAAARDEAELRWADEDRRARALYGTTPPPVEAAAHAVLRALPPETVVVEESPTADAHVRTFHRVSRPDRFFYSRGGGLGWGMAAALGVSLGMDRHPAVCIVGDGSALYAPQALWSAARLDLPVVFVVFNNGRYEILRRFLRAMGGDAERTGRYVGLDIQNPPVDFAALAGSLGVPASRVTRADEASEAVRAALQAGAPRLVEVAVAPGE